MLLMLPSNLHLQRLQCQRSGQVQLFSLIAVIFLDHSVSINQSINVFGVLDGNWDPTDTKFSSENSYRQICFLHAKHSLRKPPHAFGSHNVVSLQWYNSAAGGLNAVT